MKELYRTLGRWGWVLLLVLGLAPGAQAQSGPFGNEWIVPGQTYYKIKVTKDGIYRLDQAYLTRAGVPASANPQRLQLWRRGRQVARYIGGNRSQLDATTYVEFYGQRNDGQLDRDMYKAASHQPHQLYSMFTDTAAYFLTVSATANGRDMAEPATTAGTVHPSWLQTRMKLDIADYSYGQTDEQVAFMPWADTNEGWLGGPIGGNNNIQGYLFHVDSVSRVANTGAQAWMELLLVGAFPYQHYTNVRLASTKNGTKRLLTPSPLTYGPYESLRTRIPLQRSDFTSSDSIYVEPSIAMPASPSRDRFRLGYFRIVFPQVASWQAGQRAVSFRNDSTLAGAAYYELDNLPASVRGYNVTDPYNVQRVTGNALSGTRRGYGFAGTIGRSLRLMLADADRALVPLPATRVQFRTITPANHGFLIVSNAALMKASGPVANPVREYANYRASAVGGTHDTLVVTSDQLYDMFHYGERSPLAVKHFADFMLTAPRPDRYLLLLGKSVLITEWVGRFYRQASAAQRASVPDLVPTSTRGASDIFFTADWQRDSYVPRIPVGRVAARTPDQVMAYLNKLKAHERNPNQLDAWRKNALHLAGGQNTNEFSLFQGYLRQYQHIAERQFFGANVENIYNTTTGGATVYVNIAPQVNRGLSLITYFGHASPTALNMQPTDILQPSSGYANQDKYPVFIVSGCAAGNASTAASSLGEDWTLVPNKGAVGYLSSSDFGTDLDLHAHTLLMYRLMFQDPTWYGKPVAAIQAEVNRRLMASIPTITPGSVAAQRYYLSMLMNTIWQGDPAFAMFSPDRPDYRFTAQTPGASVEPALAGPVLATSPRFNLRLQISNPGKIIRTTVQGTITRTVPGQPAMAPVSFSVPFFRRDTVVTVSMTNPAGVSVFGNNTFVVKLDDPNAIAEVDENNNTATINFNFLNGGVTALTPKEFAIVNRANVRLVGQSNLPQAQPLDYEFQLDTIPTFRAPLRTGTVRALDVASWTPGLPVLAGRDSVVYYWRFRFRNAASTGLDTTWATSSFRFINNSPGGWSQSHYGQMASNEKRNLTQTVPGGRWEFAERTRSLQLLTAGAPDATATFQLSYGIIADGQPVRVDNCGIPGGGTTVAPANIMVAVYDGRTLRQLNTLPSGNYTRCGAVGTTSFFHFATTTNRGDSVQANNVNLPWRQRQLLHLLRNLPNGAYVALVSMNRVNFSSMDPALKAELQALGSTRIGSAQDGDPLVMVLRKGFPAQAQEATYTAGSPTPRDRQSVTLNATIRTRGGSGTVVSTRIGPAQQWQTLYHTVKLPEAADSYVLRLVGYTANNTRVVFPTTIPAGAPFSLSAVDARTYPYLQLEAELRDTTNGTAPQLKQWLVTYRGLPEGVVRRDHPAIPANAYASATLSTAAANTGVLNIPVYFENVSSEDFAGLTRAKAFITDASGRVDTSSVRASRVAGFSRLPRADSTALYQFALDVTRVRGNATIRIVANARELPEQEFFNNELNLTFTAPTITVPPVLDVAFDGTHILNGDIVSASPEILVDVKYEDKRRPLTDPSKVELYLTRPGSAVAEQVSMTNASMIRFVNDAAAGRSRVYYTPGTLADGVYKLEVQAKDMADNAAAPQRYAITFEVINQASITNVFPYPNPVTSKARFVFTLTGTTPPRNMKIQILTVTGKVVREIMQSELGNLRVGNNITDFAWDGTDQYGDRLANGTYLYRVVLDDPNSEYQQRRTAADQAFKKGWGKLVLLR